MFQSFYLQRQCSKDSPNVLLMNNSQSGDSTSSTRHTCQRMGSKNFDGLVSDFGAFEGNTAKTSPRSVAEKVEEPVVHAHLAVGWEEERCALIQ